MSKENNDQLISNITLKLDAIPNTDNTPIRAYPSSDISTRLGSISNIYSEPTSPTNLPATTYITSKPITQNKMQP